jgi:hypothetical protein
MRSDLAQPRKRRPLHPVRWLDHSPLTLTDSAVLMTPGRVPSAEKVTERDDPVAIEPAREPLIFVRAAGRQI